MYVPIPTKQAVFQDNSFRVQDAYLVSVGEIFHVSELVRDQISHLRLLFVPIHLLLQLSLFAIILVPKLSLHLESPLVNDEDIITSVTLSEYNAATAVLYGLKVPKIVQHRDSCEPLENRHTEEEIHPLLLKLVRDLFQGTAEASFGQVGELRVLLGLDVLESRGATL